MIFRHEWLSVDTHDTGTAEKLLIKMEYVEFDNLSSPILYNIPVYNKQCGTQMILICNAVVFVDTIRSLVDNNNDSYPYLLKVKLC